VLLSLAGEGRCVVCTIHQPRSSIFALFDQLLLLSEGKVLYSGPAAAAAAYFAAAGHPCPPTFNPADWLLDLTSLDCRSAAGEAASRRRVQELGERWAEAQHDAGAEVGGGLEVEAEAEAEAGSCAECRRL